MAERRCRDRERQEVCRLRKKETKEGCDGKLGSYKSHHTLGKAITLALDKCKEIWVLFVPKEDIEEGRHRKSLEDRWSSIKEMAFKVCTTFKLTMEVKYLLARLQSHSC